MTRQLDVVGRYIALLEINQRGGVKVTPAIHKEVLTLHAAGMRQADIARLLRLSTATTNLIIHGRYPLNAALRATQALGMDPQMGTLLDAERAAVLAQYAQRVGGQP